MEDDLDDAPNPSNPPLLDNCQEPKKVGNDGTLRKEVGNYVPAPAVIRRPRALSGFIGRKERVGGLLRLMLKPTAQRWKCMRYEKTGGGERQVERTV